MRSARSPATTPRPYLAGYGDWLTLLRARAEAEVLSPRTTSAKCPEDADTDGTASPQQSSDLFNPAADKGEDAPPGLRIQCSASSRRDSADVSTPSVLRKFGIRRPSDSAVKRVSQQKQQEQQAQVETLLIRD